MPVSSVISDPEGDDVFLRLISADGGQARLSADGRSVIFDPEAGRTGSVSFRVAADDGFGASAPKDVFIDISTGRLVAIAALTRMPQLNIGESVEVQWFGDFEDEAHVRLSPSYLSIVSTNPEFGTVTQGRLKALAVGSGALVASRGGVSGATAFNVGGPDDLAGQIILFSGIDVYPDAVTLAAGGGQRQFRIFMPGGSTDRSADERAHFIASDQRIITVDDTGLVTAQAEGEAILTVIYRGREQLVPSRSWRPPSGRQRWAWTGPW